MKYLQSFKIFESSTTLTDEQIEVIKTGLKKDFSDKSAYIDGLKNLSDLNKFIQFQMQENPQNFGVMDYKDIDEESAKHFLMKYLK